MIGKLPMGIIVIVEGIEKVILTDQIAWFEFDNVSLTENSIFDKEEEMHHKEEEMHHEEEEIHHKEEEMKLL